MNGIKIFLVIISWVITLNAFAQDLFPDGTPVPKWFRQIEPIDIHNPGKHYRVTDHGVVNDSTLLQTEQIQAVIDKACQMGGDVIIIPRGTYLSGSLFFKPDTHLYLEKDGVL
jgi:hypothetical protein